jgi:hypothetical protein
MSHAGSGARLSNKSSTGQFLTDELGVDDLQCYRASKVDVNGFVGHSHRAAAKFKWRAVLARENFVVFKLELRS